MCLQRVATRCRLAKRIRVELVKLSLHLLAVIALCSMAGFALGEGQGPVQLKYLLYFAYKFSYEQFNFLTFDL